MRLALRALLAGALGLAVAFLVACGDRSHLLPGSSADKLNSQLDQVNAAVSGHDCAKALAAVSAYKDTVVGLPGTVSPILRANLLQGAQTIAEMTPRDCRQSSPSSNTTPTTTTPTTTTPATTNTTPSTPTTATTTTPAPTTSVTPPPSPTPPTNTTPPETQPPSTGTNGGGGAPPPGNPGGGAGAGGAGTGNG